MHAHIIFINKIKYMLNTYIRKIQNLHMYIYVSVNLNTTRVCSLPSYPGVDGQGPVVLTYLENQRLLVACGSSDRDDKYFHIYCIGFYFFFQEASKWEHYPR